MNASLVAALAAGVAIPASGVYLRDSLSCDRGSWTFATREPTGSRRGNRTVLTRAHTGHAVCKSGDWCLSNLDGGESVFRAPNGS